MQRVSAQAAFHRVIACAADQHIIAPARIPHDARIAPHLGAAGVDGVVTQMGPALFKAPEAGGIGIARLIHLDGAGSGHRAVLADHADSNLGALGTIAIAVIRPQIDQIAAVAARQHIIAGRQPCGIPAAPADIVLAAAAIDGIGPA